MKKRKLLINILMLSTISLSACHKTAYDSLKYSENDVNVYREKNKVDKTIPIRFYENMTSIPYIGVKQYYEEFFASTLTMEKDDTIYTFTKGNSSLTFDVKKDIVEFKGIDGFSENPNFKSSTSKTFLKVSGENHSAPHIKTISLADYGINVFGDKKDAYVPLTFLSEFSGGGTLYNITYNGKDIYVLDTEGQLSNESRFVPYFADTYFDQINKMNEPRSKDMAEYAYNQLCLTFDHFRGYTSQLLVGDNNLLSLGLNGLLEIYYPKIKELLLSTDKKNYYAGVYALLSGLNDKGHTVLYCDNPHLTSEASQTIAQYEDLYNLVYQATNRSMISYAARTAYNNFRRNALNLESNEAFYYRFDNASKTAYIGFNSFVVDYSAWDSFYKGNKDESQAPITSDTYAFVRSKLYEAKDDGAENVILDLTTNGGGNSDAMVGLCGLFNEAQADFSLNNTVAKNRETYSYNVDINLDGKFDEQDVSKARSFNFKVAVLTSEYSFSCANLFPSIMKEYGYSIVGQQSGGGSCAISLGATADGITYIHSNYHCLSNQAGDNIDSGVPVNLLIPNRDEESSFDATGFYDYVTIANYLNNL